MASITACSTNLPERATRRLRRWLLLLPFLLAPLLAWAAEIEVVNPQIVYGEDGYALSADFRFELRPRLEEAVARGVVLTFVVDFEMTRERWYWFDEKVAARSQTTSLSYHALTRQYRLSSGGLHQSFATLGEALAVLSRLRNWPISDGGDLSLRPGETYQAALRMRLDINQLPRPFQISALGNRDWNLVSDWKTWTVSLPVPTEAP
ncbi:MAG: DUF4390 domain-containing protein [Azonexus sp.]|jgi:hypothetical protein|uniref:DUF4390 domain-containing protein n=1 Tax=Azonexus sp. TaxID=1872668 RepID=UPI002832314B|nr:DUF4390 domain-containing protein [Azonexus sp.]MDR0776256.1 DUF4390 domain-containing protein [Azonexus sp.]